MASNCCLNHDPTTGAPLLGLSLFTSSPNPRPLEDYKEAGKVLMERIWIWKLVFCAISFNIILGLED